jgi:hypothetical protein
LDGVRIEDIQNKQIEIDGSWVIENLRDGVAISNQPGRVIGPSKKFKLSK